MPRHHYSSEAHQGFARRRTTAPKLGKALWSHRECYVYPHRHREGVLQVWDAIGERWIGDCFSEAHARREIDTLREAQDRLAARKAAA